MIIFLNGTATCAESRRHIIRPNAPTDADVVALVSNAYYLWPVYMPNDPHS